MTERLIAKLDRLGAEAGIKEMTPEIYRFSQLLNDDKLKQWDEWRSQRTEQEPFCLHWEDRWGCNHYADPKEPHPVNAKPLYTTPPQRTWVGLTDEEKSDIWCAVTDRDFVTEDTHVYADAIEAKLKEKNT